MVMPELDIYQDQITSILRIDDGGRFVSFLQTVLATKETDKENDGNTNLCPSKLLSMCFRHNAIDCATALVGGAAGLTVNLNVPDKDGMSPLHHAAKSLSPEWTRLYLNNGAEADLACSGSGLFSGFLPLNVAVEMFRHRVEWSPDDSIYKLIVTLFRPILRRQMDTLRMIAYSSERVPEAILHYALNGKLVELAALLVVARNRVMFSSKEYEIDGYCDGTVTLRRYVATEIAKLSLEELHYIHDEGSMSYQVCKRNKKLLKTSMLLLEIFNRNAYPYFNDIYYNISGWRSFLETFKATNSPMSKKDAAWLERFESSGHQDFVVFKRFDPGVPSFLEKKEKEKDKSVLLQGSSMGGSSSLQVRNFSTNVQPCQSPKANFDSNMSTVGAQLRSLNRRSITSHVPTLWCRKQPPVVALRRFVRLV